MAETKTSYLKIAARWFVVALTAFVLTALSGSYVASQVLPKVYTAVAEIQIRPIGGIQGGPPGLIDPANAQLEFEVMQSPDILSPVVTDLNLDQIWAKRVHKEGFEKMHPLDAVAHLQSILKIDLVRGTNIVRITASSADPKETADIANAVADHYKTMRDVQEDQRNSRGLDSLQDQVTQQQKVVDEKKAALDKIRDDAKQSGTYLSSSEESRTMVEWERRRQDLLVAQEDYDARRVLLNQTKDLSDEELIKILSALGHQDPNTLSLQQEIDGAQTEMEKLRKSGAKDTDTRVVELQKKIDRKWQMMKDLIAGTRRAMQVDCDMAKSRVELLQKEVDELKAKLPLENFTRESQSYREAQRGYEEQQSILDALSVRSKQVQIYKSVLDSPVKIITRAEAPKFPSSPNRMLWLVTSVVAGLILGPVVATMTEVALWVLRRRVGVK